MSTPASRHFLFLQGPHGPFFVRLAEMLRKTGAQVWRVGFNAGDAAFWLGRPGYIPYTDTPEAWEQTFDRLVATHAITDIVLYGDTRPVHATAIARARKRGLHVHVFEEGYLRPYWVTYERGGSNGHSRLMSLSVGAMRAALAITDHDMPTPPSHWGEMRQHIFYGAAYHWFVLFRNRAYANFAPHREVPLLTETRLYTRRLLTMPVTAVLHRLAARRVRLAGYPYHVALMQLEHDASFRAHSPLRTMEDFAAKVMAGFAAGAPAHHHLVFKAHPLDTGGTPMRAILRRLAATHGLTGRVHYLPGGALGPLLDQARSAITVNSTAAQQALWRGIPLKVFGTAIYDKPEFTSSQSVSAFYANPARPETRAYRDFRRFLLETSQVPGGFYSRRGRRQVLRLVVDLMLAQQDPYETLATGQFGPRAPLRMVH